MISIVIPVKGRVDVFPATLESLLAQTCRDWEAVLVDDGSSATEASALAALAGQDGRIRYETRMGSRAGAPACRNQGFRRARGEFVLFLDSDDLLAPACLAERLRVIEAQPELDFVVFGASIFHENPGDSGLYWNVIENGIPDLDRFCRADPPWQTMCPLWRRRAVERLGGWDEEAPIWQDWEFHVRALAEGLAYRKMAVADCHYRYTREGSISNAPRDEPMMLKRAGVIVRTCNRLAGCRQWSSRHRHQVGCLLFRFALPRHGPRPMGMAHRLLRLGRDHRLLTALEYAFGYVVAGISQLPKTRATLLLIEELFLPEIGRSRRSYRHLSASGLV